jgi:hypothetical protein
MATILQTWQKNYVLRFEKQSDMLVPGYMSTEEPVKQHKEHNDTPDHIILAAE